MHAYVTEQSKFIRFQQHGIKKLYRMMKKICAKIEIEPMFSFAEIFDFEKFKEDETNRKAKEAEAKKRRLESSEKVTEGDESDEEEVDRDEMPSKFIQWGLEEEVTYEQEDGEMFTPQHPEWFRKEREKLPNFYQVITVEKTEITDKIISWMYSNLRGMFVVKRRGGVIWYFKTGYDLFSLPRWDVRELDRLDMLNPYRNSLWADFGRIISKECNKGFVVFKPQRPRRRVSKSTRDPITGKGKVTWVINPAKVVTRIKLPAEVPVCVNKFKKLFYDSQTGEAVIRSNTNEDIRILDPTDFFMFGLSDLNALNANRINVGAGNANLEEAMLFQRAVERAWKRKREMLDITDKLKRRKKKKQRRKRKLGRRKSSTKRNKNIHPKQKNIHQLLRKSNNLQPHPHMSTREEQPTNCEAILIQETLETTDEVPRQQKTRVIAEIPPEPEKEVASNPEATTEE
ncbi:hypothetical protein Hanom_Chr16g01438051 [Helianthus anomalus]